MKSIDFDIIGFLFHCFLSVRFSVSRPSWMTCFMNWPTGFANWIMWILLNNFSIPEHQIGVFSWPMWIFGLCRIDAKLMWMMVFSGITTFFCSSNRNLAYFLGKWSIILLILLICYRKNVCECELIVHTIYKISHKSFYSQISMRVVQPHSGSLCIVCTSTKQMTITTCPLWLANRSVWVSEKWKQREQTEQHALSHELWFVYITT